jgi:hypothetical protein
MEFKRLLPKEMAPSDTRRFCGGDMMAEQDDLRQELVLFAEASVTQQVIDC